MPPKSKSSIIYTKYTYIQEINELSFFFCSEKLADFVKNQIQSRNAPRAIPDVKEYCFAIKIVK